MRRMGLVALLCAPAWAHAQVMSDAEAIQHMQADLRYLASDKLEGREAGTPGEKLAAEHIAQAFKTIGLGPMGDSATYFQKFEFAGEPSVGETTHLQLGRTILKQGEEFYPLSFSANAQVRGKVLRCGYGIVAPELGTDDYAGKDPQGRCVALAISSPDGIHPHSKYLAYNDLRRRAEKAAELGATAVIFYNDDETAEPPSKALSAKVQPCSIPVLFYTGDKDRVVLQDANPCVITVDIVRPQRVAENVVAMLDNGRPNIVVIGAHFDHLGYGDEGSLWRGEPAIHNGADDNASGVAAILQIARDLKEMQDARSNDYLFIAFSGEEKGLYGSNWWTKHPTVPLKEVDYMINLDMVGRLDSLRRLAINGTGTSPAWDSVLTVLRRPAKPANKKEPVSADTLALKLSEGGIGPSDHTSFYLQDIPAIHFFTGQHEDYHKPSDDEDKINYPGMLEVVRFIEKLVVALDPEPKLAFTKTADADSAATPHFTVTLGVVPDYMYDGRGMRIDGVTDGKPASKAGLKTGDVVIKLGEVEVSDMMSYMKALGQFQKGDKTRVKVLREGREVVSDIQF